MGKVWWVRVSGGVGKGMREYVRFFALGNSTKGQKGVQE